MPGLSAVGAASMMMLLVIFKILGSDLVGSCRCAATFGKMVVKAFDGAKLKFAGEPSLKFAF